MAGTLLCAGSLQAFYPYGSGELFLKAEPQLQYDSNIFANSGEEDDVIARVPVGLLLIQDRGHIRAEANAGVEFGFFDKNRDQDYEDPFARIDLIYDREGHPFWGEMMLGWWKESQADPTIGSRPEVERRQARLRSRYRLNQRLGVQGAVEYLYWDYDEGFLSDREQYGVEVGAEYSYSPRLDVGLNYSYDDSALETMGARDVSSQDHGVFLSVRGELTPRITQIIELGVKTRDFERNELNDTTEPFAALSLLWQIDEPTSLRLTGSSDFSFSAENASISEQRVEAVLRRQIDPKIAVSLRTFYSYQDFDYIDQVQRTDDVLGFGGDLSYRFTQLISGALRATYESRTSDLEFADYERLLVSGTLLFQF